MLIVGIDQCRRVMVMESCNVSVWKMFPEKLALLKRHLVFEKDVFFQELECSSLMVKKFIDFRS